MRREVDKALKDILSTIKLDGKYLGYVGIRYPQVEWKEEEYPGISFFLYNDMEDLRRTNFIDGRSYDIDDGLVTTQEYTVPYNLYYQIDLKCKRQNDENAILESLKKKLRPKGVLKVGDNNLVMNRAGSIPTLDTVDKDTQQKIFHKVLNVIVFTELASDKTTIEDMVKTRDFEYLQMNELNI